MNYIRNKRTMNNMTWLDLYNFLHQKANDINNPDQNMWQQKVVVHNAETGDEYPTDTWIVTDNRNFDRLVLVINAEEIYNENRSSK